MRLFSRFWAGRASQPKAQASATPKAPATPQESGTSAARVGYATVADGAKSAFTVFVGGVCPFLIALILTVSAGYYFNALRPFTGDVQSFIAYGTALIVELVNLALFFVSAKAFWYGKRSHFMTALLLGGALTLISIVAQVLYLSNNLDAASIGAGAAILSSVPLVGHLASTGLIIVSRALALHVAELACCYVIARSAVSHRKIIQAQQEEQEAQIAMMESDQFMQFKRALHAAQMAQLENMREMLSGEYTRGNAPLVPFHPRPGATNGHTSRKP